MRVLGKFIITVALIFLALNSAVPFVERYQYPIRYADTVLSASEKHHVPRNLILAVIREESRFNPDSVSSARAQGLMQIQTETARFIADKRQISFNEAKIRDPEMNIDFGAWYLNYLQDQLQDNTLTIEAYNAGIANVLEWEKKQAGYIGFTETENFVKRVKLSEAAYNRIYGKNWEMK